MQDIPVRVVYMHPEAYDAWRAGAPDTEAMRAKWAADQVKVQAVARRGSQRA